MNSRSVIRRFAIVAAVVLVFDWVLAAMTVERVVPKWVFAAANPPFGILYTWFESHWNCTSYVFAGAFVSDGVGLLVMPVVALLQTGLYCAILVHVREWSTRKAERSR
jgi:hypothetical protein